MRFDSASTALVGLRGGSAAGQSHQQSRERAAENASGRLDVEKFQEILS
jgi:hypothetical protein